MIMFHSFLVMFLSCFACDQVPFSFCDCVFICFVCCSFCFSIVGCFLVAFTSLSHRAISFFVCMMLGACHVSFVFLMLLCYAVISVALFLIGFLEHSRIGCFLLQGCFVRCCFVIMFWWFCLSLLVLQFVSF